ncbi:MAG TPA: hypothetical protein VJN21_09965 [Candidatus Acidoferrales bacterium]|nr:hypothetical protein [Candidatus Acidoferrales bacterium]
MAVNDPSPATPDAPSRAPDLLCSTSSWFLWWLPGAAVFAGASWPAGRPWLWIPAFGVMAAACLINAAQCGRMHCYFTGPLFLLAALYVAAGKLGLVPMYAGTLLIVVVAGTVLAFLAEIPLGKYRRNSCC